MAKTPPPPKIVPTFIRKRGGKITIDLDKAGEAAENVGDVTLNFLAKLGADGLKVAGQVRDYLAKQGKQARDETLRRRAS